MNAGRAGTSPRATRHTARPARHAADSAAARRRQTTTANRTSRAGSKAKNNY